MAGTAPLAEQGWRHAGPRRSQGSYSVKKLLKTLFCPLTGHRTTTSLTIDHGPPGKSWVSLCEEIGIAAICVTCSARVTVDQPQMLHIYLHKKFPDGCNPTILATDTCMRKLTPVNVLYQLVDNCVNETEAASKSFAINNLVQYSMLVLAVKTSHPFYVLTLNQFDVY